LLLTSSTLLKMLNAGRYDDAAQLLLLWVNAGGHPQLGLVTRRRAELALWNSPQSGSTPTVPAALLPIYSVL
jgi:lysozyme